MHLHAPGVSRRSGLLVSTTPKHSSLWQRGPTQPSRAEDDGPGATDIRAMSADIRLLSTDNRLLSTDNRPLSTDNSLLSTDNSPLSTDNRPLSTDNSPLSTDNSLLSTDNSPLSTDSSPLSTDIGALSTDKDLGLTGSPSPHEHSQAEGTDNPKGGSHPDEQVTEDHRLPPTARRFTLMPQASLGARGFL